MKKKNGRRVALAGVRFYEPKPKRRARRIFHYGRGFGKHTWCGLEIPKWAEDPIDTGPDWGGALTESITCEACLVKFIRVTAYELNDAAQVLSNLKRKKRT